MIQRARVNVSMNSYRWAVLAICSFWYCALYPARIGADYAALLSMIREGKSTDWWTGSFYWFLRITSIDGRFPEVTSAIQTVIFALSIVWFVNSLPGRNESKKKTILFFLCTPIFGFFGMTISHDLTQTSGIILLCGLEIRRLRKTYQIQSSLIYIAGIALVLTTHSGLLIALAVLLRLMLSKQTKSALLAGVVIVVLAFMANLGLERGLTVYGNTLKTSWVKYWPSINVLKCIAQHPEAQISNSEWELLNQLAPKQLWQKPVSCRDFDIAVGSIGHANIVKNNSVLTSPDYLKTYISVFSKNPAIGVMAHIQRARGVLPPLLFQPPDNQVILDVEVPIGEGTNTALQTGPELLHPSIDIVGEEDSKPVFFKLLEIPAQGSAFLLNQASWFWGWGGLWIVIAFIVLLRLFNLESSTKLIFTLHPAILMHLAYLYFIPTSLPRYYMFSICIGILLLIYFLIEISPTLRAKKIEN